MQPASREIMAPVPSPETSEFWSEARNGRLILRFCKECDQFHHYPRSICPHCFSDQTEWRPAKGTGTIHVFSVMRRAPVPYAIAYIELDEGPLMISNIVNCDFDALKIGQPVKLCFGEFENDGKLPVFEPRGA
jgi:uncharacterized OB-fold protein